MRSALVVTAGLLAVAGFLTLVRLFRGPTLHDRLVALDTLVVVVISGIAVEAALRDAAANVILLVVVALVGFLSTVSVLRLTEGA
ncbi:monovalent cation/H+ antiporter complex subunit F [Plantactinospora sp. KLBMP9567]|uniref:monovalent cation/H+ antiporter complex subunit F n=1 Tax=Plantactinospora sp. KLBMP9567 TaxID=3085900 RepID=UPI00298208AA|nr:monovalent cation/H+ antiporter complex subunit F [Plantactinospora sp. KLBMP9567]MDW5329672.1 monovalent cation/H+ antiporter complex subunit F [Plantactinospora sp. KLBMP9567]